MGRAFSMRGAGVVRLVLAAAAIVAGPRAVRADDAGAGTPEKPVVIPATPEPAAARPAETPTPTVTPTPVPPAPPPSPAPSCPSTRAAAPPIPSTSGPRRPGEVSPPTATAPGEPKAPSHAQGPRPAGVAPRAEGPVAAESFAAICATFDAREGAAAAASEARFFARRARYDTLLAYVAAHPVAPDLEPARAALFQLPYERQDWAEALLRAQEYLKYHAAEKNDLQARTVKADVLARTGRDAEAKPAFELLCRVATPSKHGKDAVFRVWSSFAKWCLDRGDVDGAITAWRGLRQAFVGSSDAALMAATADSEASAIAKIGTPAPPWPATARDLQGRPVPAEALRGKVVLLDFWASWCRPCVAELPNVLAAYRAWHARGLEVVGVSLDGKDSLDALARLVAERGVPWPQVVDPSGTNPVAVAYGVKAIPHAILVGADGRILRVGLRGPDLSRVLSRLLGPP